MKGFYQFIKGTVTLVVAGAIGAGVILAATQSEDLLGAASGKKVGKAKGKKKNDSVWNDVAKEINKPNVPMDENPSDNIAPPAGGIPKVEAPGIVGLDPYDINLCKNNIHVGSADLGSTQLGTSTKIERTIIHGQVRGFYEDRTAEKHTCEVEIYPRSCDTTFKLVVSSNSATPKEITNTTLICDFLGQASFSERSIIVQAYRDETAPDEEIRNTYFIHRIGGSGDRIPAFLARVEKAEADYRNRSVELPGASLIERMFNRGR